MQAEENGLRRFTLRLPRSLVTRVRSVDHNKSFSEIVRSLLETWVRKREQKLTVRCRWLEDMSRKPALVTPESIEEHQKTCPACQLAKRLVPIEVPEPEDLKLSFTWYRVKCPFCGEPVQPPAYDADVMGYEVARCPCSAVYTVVTPGDEEAQILNLYKECPQNEDTAQLIDIVNVHVEGWCWTPDLRDDYWLYHDELKKVIFVGRRPKV